MHGEKPWHPKIAILLSIHLIIVPAIMDRFLANTQIGSPFEKKSYREQYYVYVSNYKNSVKQYKIPADIIRTTIGYTTCNDEGKDVFRGDKLGYFVEKIYWDNGGYVTFEFDYYYTDSCQQVILGKETECYSYDSDRYYYITLTDQKVKN